MERQTKRVQTFKQAFNRVKKETGAKSVEEFLTIFEHFEDKNFRRMNYIQELENQISKVEEEQTKMKEQFIFTQEAVNLQSASRKRVLDDIEHKIELTIMKKQQV